MDNAPADTPGIGEVLSAGTSATLDNAGLLLGLWAVCGLPPQLLLIVIRLTNPLLTDKDAVRRALEAKDWAAFAPLAVVGSVALIFGMIGHAGMVATASRVMRGQAASLGEVLTSAASRALPLLGASILVGLSFGLGLIALVLPGLYLLVRLSLAVAATIVEEKGPAAALRRSWRLVAGRFWGMVAYLLVMAALTFLAMIALLAAGVVLQIAAGAAGAAGRAAGGLVINAFQFLISSWAAACLVKLYLELAARTPEEA